MRSIRFVIVAFLLGCGSSKLPHEGKSIEQLRAMLDDSSTRTQAQGALGLSQLGPEAKDAVPRLSELLDSPNAFVRQQSALALGKIGPDAKVAVPQLIQRLDDSDWATRRQSAMALGAIGDVSALPALEKRKNDSNGLVRRAVLQSIQQLKPTRGK